MSHTSGYKINQNGFEIGADMVTLLDNGQLVTGLFTSYSDNKVKHSRGGHSSVDSYGLGAYATYFSDDGYYIDGVLKVNRFNNKLNARMTNGGHTSSDYHQWAVGPSVEVGYTWALEDNWFIEPYLKTSYYVTQSKSISLDNGMQANTGNNKSFKGELGVTSGTTFNVHNAFVTPYARLAIEREFIKSNTVKINRTYTFDNDYYGNVGKYGLGVDVRLTNDVTLFAEANYRHGQYIESPITANIGGRINF